MGRVGALTLRAHVYARSRRRFEPQQARLVAARAFLLPAVLLRFARCTGLRLLVLRGSLRTHPHRVALARASRSYSIMYSKRSETGAAGFVLFILLFWANA